MTIKRKRSGLKRVLEEKLGDLLLDDHNDDDLAEIINTRIQLILEIEKDEAYWKQRVRANWLRQGDKNIAFFHHFASARRKKNRINMLVQEDGSELRDDDVIGETATEFFQNLLLQIGLVVVKGF